jgi:hypothetical protein
VLYAVAQLIVYLPTVLVTAFHIPGGDFFSVTTSVMTDG